MIGIKKVQVVALDVNDGKIIDSFNTQDNHQTNAPSLNAVENYVSNVQSGLEDDIETKQNLVLSGTSTPSSSLGEDGDIYLQYSE